MPAYISPKITDAGFNAAVSARANGVQLAITHVALGAGAYDSEASGAAMTAMVSRREQVAVQAGIVSGTGAFKLSIKFPGWAGVPSTYEVREIGFYAGDPDAGGVLFAVFSATNFVIVVRNTVEFIASFTLQLTRVPAGSVTIQVNPNADAAVALVSQHEQASNPHPQYVRKIGDESTGPQKGVTAGQHDDSTVFATTAWVHRNGVRMPPSGGLAVTAASFQLQPEHVGRWVDALANGGSITLPPARTVPNGGLFQVRVPSTGVTILAAEADGIMTAGGESVTGINFVRGETFFICRNGSSWVIVSNGSRRPAGEVAFFSGNTAPPGWLRLNGALLSRAAYPQLWAYAMSTGGLVSEGDWFNNGYFGRYSQGTDGSNFRIPDTRGVFLRAADEGRGIDSGRIWGQYQDHDNRSHAHALYDPGHSHGVYDPGHSHGAYMDDQGSHSHEVVDPGHGHGGGSAVGQIVWNGGSLEEGRGSPDWNLQQIYASQTGITLLPNGSHRHNIGVNPSGAGVSLYGAGTGISMGANGSEARPRNIAWGAFVKF